MKKSFVKLSTIVIFFLALMLSSCDPAFDETLKIKNELDRDIKAFLAHNSNADTITIKPDEVATVQTRGGMGHSQFSYSGDQMDIVPIIIFDDSVFYKVDIMNGWDLVNTFEKSIFKKSCWEILSAEDKKWRENYEALYRITEEDYQNALLLNGRRPHASGFSVSSCLDEDRRGYYDSDTIYVTAIDDSSLKIRTTNTLFNCCSEEFWEEVSVEGNDIAVSMYEYYEIPCDCECPRSVEFVLNNLEIGQTYNILLSKGGGYGYFRFEIVFEKNTNMMFVR